MFVCLLVGCLTSQQQASVSQGRICSDNFTCCHTEIEVADRTFYLTQSQYTDTGPTSPSADPITPGAWQGSHWSANFEVTGMTRPRKKSRRKRDLNPGPSALEADALTTRPTSRSTPGENDGAHNGTGGLAVKVTTRTIVDPVHFFQHRLCPQDLGRFSPFCIRGMWPLLYLWSVTMALISSWLHLVFLVSPYFSCSTCHSIPRVPLFHVS